MARKNDINDRSKVSRTKQTNLMDYPPPQRRVSTKATTAQKGIYHEEMQQHEMEQPEYEEEEDGEEDYEYGEEEEEEEEVEYNTEDGEELSDSQGPVAPSQKLQPKKATAKHREILQADRIRRELQLRTGFTTPRPSPAPIVRRLMTNATKPAPNSSRSSSAIQPPPLDPWRNRKSRSCTKLEPGLISLAQCASRYISSYTYFREPFPDVITQAEWYTEAWADAQRACGSEALIDKESLSLLKAKQSSTRSHYLSAVKGAVLSLYDLQGLDMETMSERVRYLLDMDRFTCKQYEGLDDRFLAPQIPMMIHKKFFKSKRAIGKIDQRFLNSINPRLIALTTTMLYHCLKAWESGVYEEPKDFNSNNSLAIWHRQINTWSQLTPDNRKMLLEDIIEQIRQMTPQPDKPVRESQEGFRTNQQHLGAMLELRKRRSSTLQGPEPIRRRQDTEPPVPASSTSDLEIAHMLANLPASEGGENRGDDTE